MTTKVGDDLMKKKRNKVIQRLFLCAIMVAIFGFLFEPLFSNLNFGLDLQGGFEVLYQVKGIDGSKATTEEVNGTYKVIQKRIDGLGVSEPEITVEGDDKIRVGLAGVTDPETARNTLGRVASLTFRDTDDELLMDSTVLRSGGAKVSQDASGKPAVALSVADKDKFYKVTKRISESSDNRIVIWLDFEEGVDSFVSESASCGNLESSRCLSAATVSQGFADDVIIQGNFTEQEAEELVNSLNSGSLPTQLTEVSSKTVAASFGANSLEKTFVAGVVGIVLIMVLLIALYRFSGLIASVGMVIYTFFTFLIFWLFGGVLTLPGIAAVVIGIGMAVDANVINFSRIRDELCKGTKLKMAYKEGNKNSFMSIFDSNFTTLITAVILFIFGESSVRGFATMLIISIITTMLIMVVFVRWLLQKFVDTGYFDDKYNLFIGCNKKQLARGEKTRYEKLDFIKTRKWYYIASVILLVVGVVSLTTQGLQLGIDFKGGTSITLSAGNQMTEKTVTKDLEELGYEIASVDTLNDQSIQVKIEDSLTKEQVIETEDYFTNKYQAQTDIGVISNMVKQELIKNAIISLVLASIGIVLYLSFRFRFSYAISAIVALLHDTFFIVALFSILHLEVTSIFIAAVLSIIGYSINDTIVTFDRIRENKKVLYPNGIKKKEQLQNVVNTSLRQTLDRSIVTTLTTLIPVVSLILLGSHEILNFNIALLFGLVSGVYSSICIASQLWFDIEKKNVGKPRKKKWYEEDNEPEEKKIKGINA